MTDAHKVQLPAPGVQFIVNGIPAVGYKVFIYEAGTTTKAETWTAADGLTPNTNPAICDAEGRLNVWVPPLVPIPIVPNPPGPPGVQGPPGPPGPPGATGNTAEFSATIDITSETIYTEFFGEFIELVPAPDADQIILPVLIQLSYKYATIPYATNAANFVISWGPPTFPAIVPNGTVPAAVLEEATSTMISLYAVEAGEEFASFDAQGKNLTIALDAAPDGAPLFSIDISDGGADYAVGDTGTIDGGDDLATYEVTSETGGVVDGITLTFGGADYESEVAATTTVGGAQPGIGTGLLLDTSSALLLSGSVRITTYYRRFTVQP